MNYWFIVWQDSNSKHMELYMENIFLKMKEVFATILLVSDWLEEDREQERGWKLL